MRLSDSELFKRLIENTPFSEEELVLLILTGPTRYKDHWIEKRHGRGRRMISQPTVELKLVQRWLVGCEMSSLPIDRHATAYRNGLSIRDHVAPHTKSRYLLKLDFRDFFPSLTDSALRFRLEQDAQYSDLEIRILINLLFRKKRTEETYRLSIGAPSSPFISNYLLLDFDRRLSSYCKSNSLCYTRYADDLAISANKAGTLDPAKEFVEKLIDELQYLSLKLNEKKTVNVSKKFRRELVGLVISNQGNVSLGREEKRRLRAAVHALVHGKLSMEQSIKLRGQLAFALSVDSDFVGALCKRYGFDRVCDLPSGSESS